VKAALSVITVLRNGARTVDCVGSVPQKDTVLTVMPVARMKNSVNCVSDALNAEMYVVRVALSV